MDNMQTVVMFYFRNKTKKKHISYFFYQTIARYVYPLKIPDIFLGVSCIFAVKKKEKIFEEKSPQKIKISLHVCLQKNKSLKNPEFFRGIVTWS